MEHDDEPGRGGALAPVIAWLQPLAGAGFSLVVVLHLAIRAVGQDVDPAEFPPFPLQVTPNNYTLGNQHLYFVG